MCMQTNNVDPLIAFNSCATQLSILRRALDKNWYMYIYNIINNFTKELVWSLDERIYKFLQVD